MASYFQESAEVKYARDRFITLEYSDLHNLKNEALANPRKRIRVCTHQDINDVLQEMFIVHTSETYVRPHKHIGKQESFSVLEGEVEIVFFSDDGKVIQVSRMGAIKSGLPFYLRATESFYHTLIIRSDILVFHELTKGPFERKDTTFAEWSPNDFNMTAVRGLPAEEIASKMVLQ